MEIVKLILCYLFRLVRFVFVWFVLLPLCVIIGLANDTAKPTGR